MPLVILGLIFIVGIFIYYMVSTSSGKELEDGSEGAEKDSRKRKDYDLRKEDNVIYLSDDIDKIKRNHNIGGRE